MNFRSKYLPATAAAREFSSLWVSLLSVRGGVHRNGERRGSGAPKKELCSLKSFVAMLLQIPGFWDCFLRWKKQTLVNPPHISYKPNQMGKRTFIDCACCTVKWASASLPKFAAHMGHTYNTKIESCNKTRATLRVQHVKCNTLPRFSSQSSALLADGCKALELQFQHNRKGKETKLSLHHLLHLPSLCYYLFTNYKLIIICFPIHTMPTRLRWTF